MQPSRAHNNRCAVIQLGFPGNYIGAYKSASTVKFCIEGDRACCCVEWVDPRNVLYVISVSLGGAKQSWYFFLDPRLELRLAQGFLGIIVQLEELRRIAFTSSDQIKIWRFFFV